MHKTLPFKLHMHSMGLEPRTLPSFLHLQGKKVLVEIDLIGGMWIVTDKSLCSKDYRDRKKLTKQTQG